MTTATTTKTATEQSTQRGFHFRNLAVMDCLEIVANDPAFALAVNALPAIGQKTKPAATTSAGFMLVGVATVLFGGDDRATAELRAQWPRFQRICSDLGIPMPDHPLSAQNFRDFRDKFLGAGDGLAAINDVLKTFVRAAAVGQAAHMGLLHGHDWDPTSAPDGWFGLPSERMLIGDGTWMAEMYEPAAPETHKRKNSASKQTRIPRHTRSKSGVRRVTQDADRRGNAHGYEHLLLSVRGQGRHQAIVLDIDRCQKGEEMNVLTESLRRLREMLPDTDLGLVYDGAMVGKHHTQYREELGLLTINDAPGADGTAYRQYVGQPRPKNATDAHDRVVEFTASNGTPCPQTLELLAGVLFRIENGNLPESRHRTGTVEHVDVRRVGEPGSYRWELDIEFHCLHHNETHRTTIDPHAAWGTLSGADKLRIMPANHARYRELYGMRNFSEGLNHQIKNVMMRTRRARSTTAERHEFDLIMAVIAHNAVSWAEYGGDRYEHLTGR